MYIVNTHEEGMAAVADEAMISGQIVKWTVKSDEKLHASKVSSAGDEDGKLGIAYVDPARKQYMEFGEGSRNTNALATQNIALDEVIAVIHGRFRGMSNQLADATYAPGDELTVDWTNAVWTKATAGDTVFARVQANASITKVTSKDNMVPIMGCLPEAL